ncbi:cytochrome c [Panacibacter sp. DH6]|uniref:Cytochrome c n=1 Tax=Panacibacter microcysteis TaxID=2793269 RepID=A0A931E167_9BACT|nr:cytochrome c [Panacibacter microcysteis]MBG9375183.1 cytochrome c [Panacibacter microcysteis]
MKAIMFISAICLACTVLFSSFRQQTFDLKASIERGKDVYSAYCQACHMDEGQGVEGAFPPLAKSDYLMADKKRSVEQVIYGVKGEMKVNGVIYNGEMPESDLRDEQVSDVLNYIRNSFGNKGAAVTPADVKALRK